MGGNPFIVGLLGGIASGKSTVAGILRDLGATVVDADRIVHEILRGNEVRDRVVELLGSAILAANGDLDRTKIGEIVFGDEESLRKLEAIVHPAVRERLVSEIRAADDAELVVLDAPLLIEGELAALTDVLVFVASPASLRRDRAAERDGWTDKEHALRESRQASLNEKRRRAALTIENDGSIAVLEARVGTLHGEILAGRRRKED